MTVDLLDGLPVGQVGVLGILLLTPWALLAFAIRRIVTGDLVARAHLLDIQADRDHWRASADKWQEVSTRHGMTLERLLSLAEAGNHLMTEIQTAGQHREEPR